jgi:hypothetical protein
VVNEGGSQIMTTSTTVKKPKVTKLYSIVYRVESETTKGKFYIVFVKDDVPLECSCPAFEHERKIVCKHMYRVMESIECENFIDETEKPEKLTTVSPKSWRDDDYDY